MKHVPLGSPVRFVMLSSTTCLSGLYLEKVQRKLPDALGCGDVFGAEFPGGHEGGSAIQGEIDSRADMK